MSYRDGMAKAGHRKPPAAKGPHNTTAEERKRGRFLARFGFKLGKRRKARPQAEDAR